MRKAIVWFAPVCAFAGFLLAGVASVLLPRKWVVAADAASETLAWWEHLAAAVLVALIAHGLIKTRLHSRVEAIIDHG